jgi:hypothetical protein
MLSAQVRTAKAGNVAKGAESSRRLWLTWCEALGSSDPRPYIARKSKEGKDHYIPVFYLSQWNGPDHELCEFRRRDGKIDRQRIGPKGTGLMRGSYSVPGVPPEKARYVETELPR